MTRLYKNLMIWQKENAPFTIFSNNLNTQVLVVGE